MARGPQETCENGTILSSHNVQQRKRNAIDIGHKWNENCTQVRPKLRQIGHNCGRKLSIKDLNEIFIGPKT